MGGSVDDAVQTIGCERGNVLLRSVPACLAANAGCQDCEWLVGQAFQGGGLVCGGSCLDVLIQCALEVTGCHTEKAADTKSCGGRDQRGGPARLRGA